jgi:RNA polymerase sigma factor (TIGR02999 family)
MLSRTPPGHTIQATALVHEAYLRLVGPQEQAWAGKTQFFQAAARSMRDILVEDARRKASLKRGGDLRRTEQDLAGIGIEPPSPDMIALDAALERLEAVDPLRAQLVNLRYFAGLTDEEIGEVLGCSARTIRREWRFVRAWLQAELAG